MSSVDYSQELEDSATPDVTKPSVALQGNGTNEKVASHYRGVQVARTAIRMWKAMIKIKGASYDLGCYKEEKDAARAYDLASVCLRGLIDDQLNFPAADYAAFADGLTSISIDDLSSQLRSQSDPVPRIERATSYQGVRWKKFSTGGKWEAILRVGGGHVYLGIYEDDKYAAQIYDQAVMLRWAQGVGPTSYAEPALPVLNFPPQEYEHLLRDDDINKAGASAGNEVYSGEGVSRAPRIADKFSEAVLQACKDFHAASTAIKNALNGEEGGEDRETVLYL